MAFSLYAAVKSRIAPDELIDTGKAGVAQRLALEDSEPYLDLIEPARAGGREVEGDVRVRGEPLVVPLVSVEIVQDNVNLPLGRLIGDHLIHEGLEVGSFLGLRGLATDDAGGNLQRSKEVDRPVTLIRAFDPLDDLATAGLNVPSRTLQRLNGWFLIDAEHQSILRRVQVQPSSPTTSAVHDSATATRAIASPWSIKQGDHNTIVYKCN